MLYQMTGKASGFGQEAEQEKSLAQKPLLVFLQEKQSRVE